MLQCSFKAKECLSNQNTEFDIWCIWLCQRAEASRRESEVGSDDSTPCWLHYQTAEIHWALIYSTSSNNRANARLTAQNWRTRRHNNAYVSDRAGAGERGLDEKPFPSLVYCTRISDSCAFLVNLVLQVTRVGGRVKRRPIQNSLRDKLITQTRNCRRKRSSAILTLFLRQFRLGPVDLRQGQNSSKKKCNLMENVKTVSGKFLKNALFTLLSRAARARASSR